MTRPTRMLVVIGGFGLLGVIVLGSMAKRYQTILERDGAATVAAAGYQERRVEEFLAVRRALQSALDEANAGAPADGSGAGQAPAAELRRLWERELKRVGMSRRSYLEVRSDWRRWQRDDTSVPRETAGVFEARRDELEAVALAGYESFGF